MTQCGHSSEGLLSRAGLCEFMICLKCSSVVSGLFSGSHQRLRMRSMTSHAIKGSDIFVRALENEGVEFVVGVRGEENLDMLESLRTSRIKVVVTRHEQVAGFMAATYGRLTGKPGVCLSTLGPGATNLVTAAAHASLGGM